MISRPTLFFFAAFVILLSSLAIFATSNGAWLTNVPQRDRERVNPYRDQPDAIAAGHRIFLDHCAHCHGNDAEGTKKRPSLRSHACSKRPLTETSTGCW